MVITESILSIVLEAAKKNKAKRVKEVDLKIGGLTNVVPECVEFYFDILSEETLAEGAKLKIETVPVRVKCAKCEKVFEPEVDLVFFCPDCQELSSDIVSGRELAVASIDID